MTSTTPPPAYRTGLRATLACVLTALAVVVGSVGLAAPAQAATTHVTLTGRSTAWSDQKTTLTATWKVGSQAHQGKVTLQRKSGKTWTKVASTSTTSKGVAKFSVKPASTTTYRVLTSSKKTSGAKKLTVKKAYTLTSTAGSTIMAGTATMFTLTYRHRGKAASGTALVERRSGSRWVRVTGVDVGKGRGTVTLRPAATTTYRFRVSGKATSASHTVTVRAPSTFTITGSGAGHGVGLSQYGAYEMALDGYSAGAILEHFYTGTTVRNVTTPERIKVQVWGPEPYSYAPGTYSDSGATTTLSFSGTWSVASADMRYSLNGTAEERLQVTVTGSGDSRHLLLTEVTGSTSSPVVTGSLPALSATTTFTATWAGLASVSGAHGTYRNGTLVITAIGAQPNVVNDVLLNTEYLYGIAEMPSSWGSGDGEAALEAQAVIARTYALSKLDSINPRCNCNVVDDVRDQNYTGWTKQGEGPNGVYGDLWVAAVDATATDAASGQVVTYAGQPIQTPYFAASGGRTANNGDVWQSAATVQEPYLVSVSDPADTNTSATHNPYVSWTRSITQAQAKKIFSYASVPLADVKSISVSQRYASGQVRELEGTSAGGKTAYVSASPEWWRSTLGLPAAWIRSFTPEK